MTGRQFLFSCIIGGLATMMLQAVWAIAYVMWKDR